MLIFKRILTAILAALLFFTAISSFSGCGGDGRVGKSRTVGGHTYWYYD